MLVGGIAGGALGVLTGGVGWLALGGAAAVGLTSRVRDSGFDNKALHSITDELEPNQSMLLCVCANADADRVSECLRECGALALMSHRLDVDTTVDLTITSALEVFDRESEATGV
jgi:uncharacterized membrane protein